MKTRRGTVGQACSGHPHEHSLIWFLVTSVSLFSRDIARCLARNENPRRGRRARNFSENDPKILDLKSSSEQINFGKLSLGVPDLTLNISV